MVQREDDGMREEWAVLSTFDMAVCDFILFQGQQSNITYLLLKPLCLSKQLTLSSQQHIDQLLFPGHIV